MLLEGCTETETTRPKLSDNSSVAKKRADVNYYFHPTPLHLSIAILGILEIEGYKIYGTDGYFVCTKIKKGRIKCHQM